MRGGSRRQRESWSGRMRIGSRARHRWGGTAIPLALTLRDRDGLGTTVWGMAGDVRAPQVRERPPGPGTTDQRQTSLFSY